VHRLPREILRKRDSHRTSTNFRLRVIRWGHEIFKRPSLMTLRLAISGYKCLPNVLADPRDRWSKKHIILDRSDTGNAGYNTAQGTDFSNRFSVTPCRGRGFTTAWSPLRLHHRIQTGPGVHSASYPMGTEGSFVWG